MKDTIKNLKRVYNIGRDYKKNLIMLVVLSLIFIVFNIIVPIFGAKQITYLSTNMYSELILASILIFVINVISAFNHMLIGKHSQQFFRGTTKNIQIAASKEMLKIELQDIDSKSSGTFIQRISNDADEMSKVFTRGMGFLCTFLTDIGIFIAILIINRTIFLYYLLCSSFLTILHLIRVRKYNEEDKKYRKQREKTSGLIGELVRGIRDIKMLNAKDSFMSEIEDNIDKLSINMFNMRDIDKQYNCVIRSMSAVIELVLIIILISLLKNGVLTMSLAIVLFNYRQRVLGNLIESLGQLLSEIKGFNLSCNRVFSILDEEFKKETFGTKHLKKIEGNFEFKNVNFGYTEEKLVLKDLSFKVKANETVAFVGRSGSGKTTIFSLLCKLYNIQSGEILLDGNNINDLDEYSIRNNITIISQNPYIFNLSIRDNLRLVKENLTEEEMIKACKMACLDEFINTLPDGYDTIIGEGGVTLSGGQRQRLAIARAFVQDTEIILFDEATSALDNETQAYIQKAINNLQKKCTILIIAHRLSTIINSDKIMIIDDGKIVATGKHKTLLKNNKMYKQLYETEIIE